MKQQFKVGDKVYFPIKGNKIYTLKQSVNKTYPLIIEFEDDDSTTFTRNGIYYTDHENPSIFHATKRNKELLDKLFETEFEEPVSFLDYHLSLGSKVLCLIVFEPRELPTKIWEVNSTNEYIGIVSKKLKDTYYSINNSAIRWDHLLPIAIDSKGNITYLE